MKRSMFGLLACCLLLVSSSTFAANVYKIDFDLEVPGISQKNAVIVADGSGASMSVGGLSIAFIPKQQGNGAVEVEFEINPNPASDSISSRRGAIITQLNNPAEMMEHDGNGSLIFKLKIAVSLCSHEKCAGLPYGQRSSLDTRARGNQISDASEKTLPVEASGLGENVVPQGSLDSISAIGAN